MPNRSRKKRQPDPNVTAFSIIQAIAGETPPEPTPHTDGKDPIAVELGRRGGLKGGKARAKAMTKKQRVESAKRAATARWNKQAKP